MKLLYKIGIGVGIIILLYISIVIYLYDQDVKKIHKNNCYMSDEFNLSNDYIKSRLDNINRLLDNDSYLNHGLKTT